MKTLGLKLLFAGLVLLSTKVNCQVIANDSLSKRNLKFIADSLLPNDIEPMTLFVNNIVKDSAGHNPMFKKKEIKHLKKIKSRVELAVDLLIENENFDCNCCSKLLVEKIAAINSPISLAQIIAYIDKDPTFNQYLEYKKCILKLLRDRLTYLTNRNLALYNFALGKKKIIKAININSANDLLNLNVQPNLDRDYTGGLHIGISTDYLNIFHENTAIKSFQCVYFGADVYTPRFQDNTELTADASVDSTDRPFGSFQYFGYGKHNLLYNWLKWDFDLKFGKIGGARSQILQSVLHQDISYSPRPYGWGAQIANKGRTGLSLNLVPELLCTNWNRSGNRVYISAFADLMFGSFMTYSGAGINISNKNFRESNYYYNATHRNTIKRNFLLNLRFTIKKIAHNTMLEGYGWNNNNEHLNDSLTPKSLYVLPYDSVQRVVKTMHFTIAYNFKTATLFYRISATSPETYLKGHNLNNRIHVWGTLGVSFIRR